MKGTSIFQFKSWPKIHQPLPRTPRESQQLLNALTSSFRRQLDCAYPVSNAFPSKDGDRQPVNTESSVHATDRHLHNILDNPLFRIVPPKHVSHDRRSVEEQRRLAEEPMVVFDEMVASGSASASAITECLKSQLLLARFSDNDKVRDAMRDSKAASRVVNWFWASDGASRRMLLQSRASTGSLAKFMVAEGLQSTVMDWLKMLMKGDLGGYNGLMITDSAQQAFSHLLVDFLDAEIRYGGGLDSALNFYLRAYHMHSISQESRLESTGSTKAMLLAAGAQLSRVFMDEKPLEGHVSGYMYDSFMEVISTLASTRSLLHASVAVCHPTHPDPEPFVRFTEALTPGKFEKYSAARRDVFLRIGCEALRILMIERRDDRAAARLARQIQNLLPDTTVHATTSTSPKGDSSEGDYLLSRLELNLT